MRRFTSKTINFIETPLTALSTGYQDPLLKAISEIRKELSYRPLVLSRFNFNTRGIRPHVSIHVAGNKEVVTAALKNGRGDRITTVYVSDDYRFNHYPSRKAYRGKLKRGSGKGKDEDTSVGEGSQDALEGYSETPGEGEQKDSGEGSSKN
ncbi:hypothetical protein PG991_016316 [Apiospora marii]|uniref:Uncharacterized protein n=1 Tax=Apiospora marii TaxID=335849 RepID=A0ABR1QZY2_9PEZI